MIVVCPSTSVLDFCFVTNISEFREFIAFQSSRFLPLKLKAIAKSFYQKYTKKHCLNRHSYQKPIDILAVADRIKQNNH